MSSSTSHVQARGQLASHPCCIAHSPANAERRLTFCNTLVNAEWDVVLYAGWLSVAVSQMSPIRDLPLPLAWSAESRSTGWFPYLPTQRGLKRRKESQWAMLYLCGPHRERLLQALPTLVSAERRPSWRRGCTSSPPDFD